ncbi:MAG: hypothetical protein NVSMB15_12550 [Steroidobacteraceae bacterium]
MEREFLLTVLILLLGGLTLQCFAAWPRKDDTATVRQLERRQWLALWWPAAPTLMVTIWLCGWALSQPDPVRDPVGPLLFIVCAPFGLIVLRAAARALWSLARSPGDCGVATVGILRPHIVFAPQLAKRLDDRAISAALAHEQAHVRHRDPLRIWIAQWVTDLQWPWQGAQDRFASWLSALELARDDEARAAGVDGADLAAALIGLLRFQGGQRPAAGAGLIGRPEAVQARIERLLRPLPNTLPAHDHARRAFAALLLLTLVLALLFGLTYGERVIGPLLALST